MDTIDVTPGTNSHRSFCYPNIGQAIRLLLLCLLLTIAISIPIGILLAASETPVPPEANAFISLLAIGYVLKRGLKKTQAPFREVFSFAPFRLSLFLPMSLTILGIVVLLSEADNLLRTFLPAPQWVSEVFSSLMQPEQNLWGSLFALVIVPPLTEELLFRGLILRGFLSRYSVRKSVVVSAILFGVFHLNPWQLLGGTTWGLLFGWWFAKTRSLLPCLFSHALANSFALLASALPFELQGLTGQLGDQARFQPLWLDLAGVALAGLGIWLLVRMFRASQAAVSEDVPGAEPP